jgi:hypothetical protein
MKNPRLFYITGLAQLFTEQICFLSDINLNDLIIIIFFSPQTLAQRLYGVMAWVIPILVACSIFGAANGNAFAGGR